MRIKVLAYAVLVLAGGLVWAQQPGLGGLDFSKARLSVAGPESFYLRQVGVDGRQISLLISRKTGGTGWQIDRIVPEEENFAASGVILDFASINVVDASTLEIGGILLDGKVYKGRVALSGDGSIAFLGETEATELDEASRQRAYETLQVFLDGSQDFLQQEVTRLQTENTDLKKQLETQRQRVAELERGKSVDASTLAELEKKNTELEAEVAALRQRVQNTSTPNGETSPSGSPELWLEPAEARPPVAGRETPSGGTTTAPTSTGTPADARVSELLKRITALEREIATLTLTLDRLKDSGWFGVRKEAFSKVLLQGFRGSSTQLGRWRTNGETAEQLDGSQYFAKLAIPVTQTRQETLYSFTGRSTGRGWVGYGLHIFVDDVRKKRGYGQGSSLLVWITRDRETYHNDDTYLQVYRSDDDIHMERVMEAKIQEDIDGFLQVDVLYDPEREYITLALNGVEKVRYKTFFAIDDGLGVALRTLGPGAMFKNLRVSAKP